MRHSIRIGCSGWVYRDWRERFYPTRLPQPRWLEHYAATFDTVKLNTTFYRLATALERVAALPPGRHAFEFRHPRWFVPEVEALLRRHGAALVIGDTPQRPFQTRAITADWTLVRFHHGARGRRGNYSEAELRAWAEQLREWARTTDVYAYFNNDWEGFAVRNALRLRTLLSAERVG